MKRYTQKPQEQLLSLNRLREVERKLDLIAKEFQQKKILDPEKIVLDHFEFMDLFKISRRTSQYWRAQSKIRYSLIGGRIYFSLADVQQLLQQNRVSVVQRPQLEKRPQLAQRPHRFLKPVRSENQSQEPRPP